MSLESLGPSRERDKTLPGYVVRPEDARKDGRILPVELHDAGLSAELVVTLVLYTSQEQRVY